MDDYKFLIDSDQPYDPTLKNSLELQRNRLANAANWKGVDGSPLTKAELMKASYLSRENYSDDPKRQAAIDLREAIARRNNKALSDDVKQRSDRCLMSREGGITSDYEIKLALIAASINNICPVPPEQLERVSNARYLKNLFTPHRGKGRINLKGHTYGKLTVLEHSDGDFWCVRCECGKEKTVRGAAMRSGKTLSCGCMRGKKNNNGLGM